MILRIWLIKWFVRCPLILNRGNLKVTHMAVSIQILQLHRLPIKLVHMSCAFWFLASKCARIEEQYWNIGIYWDLILKKHETYRTSLMNTEHIWGFTISSSNNENNILEYSLHILDVQSAGNIAGLCRIWHGTMHVPQHGSESSKILGRFPSQWMLAVSNDWMVFMHSCLNVCSLYIAGMQHVHLELILNY